MNLAVALFSQSSIVSGFATEKAISLIKLCEATMAEMREKITELDNEVASLKTSRESEEEVKKLHFDYGKSCDDRAELTQSLEDLRKEKLSLKEEVCAMKEDLKLKPSECELITCKHFLSEDTKERLREQIVKDAHTISDLNSQVGPFNKELQEANSKAKMLLLHTAE